MKILITTNQEKSHDFLVKKITDYFPREEFLIIRQGKKTHWIKTLLLSFISVLLLDKLLPRKNSRRLEVDKYRKFNRYFSDLKISKRVKQYKLDINSKRSIEIIKKNKPDGIIVLGGKIIKPFVLKQVKGFSLHLHCGLVPYYRGGTTWYSNFTCEDYNNCGFTIQALDEGIDTGDIISQQQIQINKGETTWDAYCKCIVAGTHAIIELVDKFVLDSEYSLKAFPLNEKGFNHTGKFLFHKYRLQKTAKKMYANKSTDNISVNLNKGELINFKHKFLYDHKKVLLGKESK